MESQAVFQAKLEPKMFLLLLERLGRVGVGCVGGCCAEVAHEGAERALLLFPGQRRLQLRGAPCGVDEYD